MQRVNIVGAGRVGQSLALCAVAHPQCLLQSVYCQTQDKAKSVVKQLGQGQAVSKLDGCSIADIWVLSVTDDAIDQVAAQLAAYEHIDFTGSIIFHCAGAVSSNVLQPLKKRGAIIAGFHPVKAFPAPLKEVAAWQHVICTTEGDAIACTWLKNFFSAFKAQVLMLTTSDKNLYHAGAVLAAGHAVTLLAQSMACFIKSGVEEADAKAMAVNLFEDVLHAVRQTSLKEALTGPVKRGDWDLIKKSEAALEACAPDTAELYALLAKLGHELV